jgi:CheY-like chemotaxis protein
MDNASSTPGIVLVVEDEPIVRACVADLLEQSGFEVMGASTGEEAIDLIAKCQGVGVVVSDVAMPGSIDGFDLARWLDRDRPRIGVVLVSGVREPDTGTLPSGARFLTKPVRASTLLRLVREVAEARPKLREHPSNEAT